MERKKTKKKLITQEDSTTFITQPTLLLVCGRDDFCEENRLLL